MFDIVACRCCSWRSEQSRGADNEQRGAQGGEQACPSRSSRACEELLICWMFSSREWKQATYLNIALSAHPCILQFPLRSLLSRASAALFSFLRQSQARRQDRRRQRRERGSVVDFQQCIVKKQLGQSLQIELLMSDNETAVANPDVQVPEGNFKAGKTLFEDLCKSCHKMRGDGSGEQAPPLGGIIGRRAGTTKYNSSQALKNSNIVWTKEHLFLYLKNPGLYVKNMRQSFLKGFLTLEDPQERADLIQYMADFYR